MKKLSALIFYLGLGLSVAGFFVDKADKFPFVLRTLAPSYMRASKGIETLNQRGYLIPSDKGFSEIENIYYELANEKGLLDRIGDRKVLRFERRPAEMVLDGKRVREVIPVHVVLVDARIELEMASIEQGVEALRETKLLRYSLVIMVIGVAGLVISRFVENGQSSKSAKTLAHRLALWKSRVNKKERGAKS